MLGLYAARAWLVSAPSPSRDHFVRSLPYWATYTANWFVDFDVAYPIVFAFGWSLAAEEQFYALWPWLARTPRWVMPAAAAALLVVDQSVELGFLGASWPRLTQRIVVSIASPICMGALLACALDDAASFRVAARVLGRRACAPVLAVALAILLGWWRSPLAILEAVMALLVAACCIRPDHGLAPLLGARPLRFVGTISYALYLVHVAAITSAKHLLPSHASDAPIIFVAGLGIGLPMAWVLHEALDVPLEPLRARLRGAARRPSRPERGSRPSRETTRSSPTPRSP